MATLGNFTAAVLTAAELNAIGTWTTWTPSWSGITVGNGTTIARYSQVNKIVHCRVQFTMGSTSSVAGPVTFTLPATASSSATVSGHGFGQFTDAGTTTVAGAVRVSSTTTAELLVMDGGSAWLTYFGLTSTRPFTWATSDLMLCSLTYEAA
jgi:hypothetical protein